MGGINNFKIKNFYQLGMAGVNWLIYMPHFFKKNLMLKNVNIIINT